MNTFKKIVSLFCVFLLTVTSVSAKDSEYEEWEKHDVKGIYIEVSDENDADIEEDNRYFKKYRRVSSGIYEIEMSEKVTSKLWKIKGTQLFIQFRFNPFLFRYDEGVFKWDGFDGIFYKKP